MTESMPNFFSLLRKKRRFRGRFDHLVCVSRPGEVIADVDPEEPEAADHFHCGTIDMQGCMLLHLPSPIVHNHLLCLADVEREAIILTPCSQGSNLLSVG